MPSVLKNYSAKELLMICGKGFTKTNLYSFYSFYKGFPQIFHAVSGKSQNPSAVMVEMKELTANSQRDNQKFLMELGKGYAFVARQQRVHTEKEDYYIDLVFYNYILKCFVLVDLKTNKIAHQDVGQMDMYIRIYDELKRSEDDNPTIGIVLCSDTEEELRAEIEMQKTMCYLQKEIQAVAQLLFYENQSGENLKKAG